MKPVICQRSKEWDAHYRTTVYVIGATKLHLRAHPTHLSNCGGEIQEHLNFSYTERQFASTVICSLQLLLLIFVAGKKKTESDRTSSP